LIQASDGNLYGTTLEGGAYGDSSTGKGTVFKVTLSGDESVLYNFTGANGDGDYPQGGVIQASDGNFYGTTFFGGAYGAASLGYGTVFKLTPSGKETVLHSFTDANGDGSNPGASLIQASDGNLYGTTLYGGAYGTTVESSVDSYGYGTVFKITLSGDETVVHSFSNADGAVPMSSLIQASDGNLYGTTSQGGSASVGTVFKLAVNLPIQYTLTASSGSNGSIYPSGTVPVIAGSSQMFTATPSSGYQVNQWSLDGTVVQTGGLTYTVSDVRTNHTVSVTFSLAGVSSHSRFDFNGDGKDDLIWANSQTGQVVAWDMNGTVISPTNTGSVFTTINPIWQVKGVADINADGHPDLLWWDSHTGQMIFWEMTGALGTTQLYTSPVLYTVANTQWQPVSMADFDGDGHPDILWENMTTGQLIIWYMNGTTQKSATGVFATLPANCRVAGTGDFNQDGHPDIVVENVKTGAVSIWYMGGSGGTTIEQQGAPFVTINTAWQIASTGDTNGDGHPDLTWHNASTGQTIVWLMGGANGTTQLSLGTPLAVTPAPVWNIVGVR
jgi:uncharacterized repeat protein (TIGR03803 family)